MPFLENLSNFKPLQNKKEFSVLLIIVLLSSVAGIGLAFTIEKFVLNKNSKSTTKVATVAQPQTLEEAIKQTKKISSSSSSVIKSSSLVKPKIVDLYGRKITYKLIESGVNAGYVWDTDIHDLGQSSPFDSQITPELLKVAPTQPKPIEELVPAPTDCPEPNNIKQKKNWLEYPKYNVEAPIQNASFNDFYYTNPSTGFIDLNRPIEEDQREINRGNYESVPVQKLLKAGIVHLPITPAPGQVGNSYIIGHTSNFPQVQSDYNYIFKPFERKSQVGEEFYIWDHRCRKLKFVVFESLAIREEDIDTAYKNFGDKRIVTLQGSILELVNGYLQPTKRWLTRGELVLK